eukprot:124039-Chlamydomonas_euryale.AAC.4
MPDPPDTTGVADHRHHTLPLATSAPPSLRPLSSRVQPKIRGITSALFGVQCDAVAEAARSPWRQRLPP